MVEIGERGKVSIDTRKLGDFKMRERQKERKWEEKRESMKEG